MVGRARTQVDNNGFRRYRTAEFRRRRRRMMMNGIWATLHFERLPGWRVSHRTRLELRSPITHLCPPGQVRQVVGLGTPYHCAVTLSRCINYPLSRAQHEALQRVHDTLACTPTVRLDVLDVRRNHVVEISPATPFINLIWTDLELLRREVGAHSSQSSFHQGQSMTISY